MVSFNHVLAAVKQLLEIRFPGEDVYTNLTPANFKRPSWLVSFGEVNMGDASFACVDIALPVTVTAIVEEDEYHNSHFEELSRRMQSAMELLAMTSLAVDGRHLRVGDVTGDMNYDFASLTIPLSYQDDRPNGVEYPLITDVSVSYQTKED